MRVARRLSLVFLTLIGVAAAGCSGNAGGGDPPPPGSNGGSGGSNPPPSNPPPSMPPPDAATSPPVLDAARPDTASPPPADGPRPDAGTPRDGPPADTGGPSGDAAGPSADGGAAPPMGGRMSLNEALAAQWTGARRSTSMEGAIRVFTGVFQANQFGGPAGHNERLPISPGREYLFEYRIRFDTGFDFSRGGKIPGLAGATAPTGCVTTTGTGFSSRSMWRQNGRLIGYTYDNDQNTACGNAIQTDFSFSIGRWHTVKQRVKLNTGTARNGHVQLWVDDREVINRTNIPWMNEAPNRRIDVVLFHSFFGGSTQDWAPSRNCSISFSEVYVTKLAD